MHAESVAGANLLKPTAVMTRLTQATQNLPSPEGICLAVIQIVQDQKTSLPDLQRLIETDMALAGRVLKVANSSFFGSRERISSLSRAIDLLGFGMVKTLALSVFLNEAIRPTLLVGLPYGDLHRYAILTGSLAGTIARMTAPQLADNCETLGLIHECGVLVMARATDEWYETMLARGADSGATLDEMEQASFGVTHAHAGQLQLARWRLPEPLV